DTEALSKLAALTGPAGDRPGFTYSDLTQRLIPSAILTAFPDKPLTADILLAAAASTDPTPEVRHASRRGRRPPRAPAEPVVRATATSGWWPGTRASPSCTTPPPEPATLPSASGSK